MKYSTAFNWKLPLLLAAVFLFTAINISGQDIEAKITLISSSRVRVEGKFLDSKLAEEKSWTFLQHYADVENLGARIDNLTIYNEANETVAVKRFSPGIYESSGSAANPYCA